MTAIGQQDCSTASRPVQRVMREVVAGYNRLRGPAVYDHSRWRRELIDFVAASKGISPSEAGSLVDAYALSLLELADRLARAHGTPDLGNKSEPVDELVYIILSRRTREAAYGAAYAALRERFADWDQVRLAELEEVEQAIAFSGLGRRKAWSIVKALEKLTDLFGCCTLDPVRDWTDQAVMDFLCTLPEIGPKSAACVMMCSLDRPVFPVDAHVGRVLERLRVLEQLGIDLGGRDHKYKQAAAWDAVPPAIRFPLHVNVLVHGRAVCRSRQPRCGSCVIRDTCGYVASGR